MGVFIRQSTITKKNGFTLAELMIAVGIIAILTITGLVAMQNQTRRARDHRRQSDLEQIRAALEQYRLTSPTKTYPTPGDGEPFTVLAPFITNFVTAIPRDPLGSTRFKYAYHSPAQGQAPNGTSYELCARLETAPAGTSAAACGGPLRCSTVSGENCNLIITTLP